MTDKNKKSQGEKMFEKVGATKEDTYDYLSEEPTSKSTIDKNIALIRHIKENKSEMPEEFRDEVYDTIMRMTERKMLDASNMFSYVVADKLSNHLDRLCDSVVAMQGIMMQVIAGLNAEVDELLSPSQKGVINVLFFGRTTEELPTKKELLQEMRDFNKMSDKEKAKSKLGNALMPTLVQKTQRCTTDIMEQLVSTGIYSSSVGSKIIMGAINEGILDKLFLPTADGNGAYAVRVSEGMKKKAPKLPNVEEINEMINELMNTIEDNSEMKAKIKKLMNDFDKQDKKEKN